MQLNFSRTLLVFSVAVTAAATLVSVAGASRSQAAAGASSPEVNQIAPINSRTEGVDEDDISEKHGKSKKHNGVATPVVNPTSVSPTSNAVTGHSFEGMRRGTSDAQPVLSSRRPGMCVGADPSSDPEDAC